MDEKTRLQEDISSRVTRSIKRHGGIEDSLSIALVCTLQASVSYSDVTDEKNEVESLLNTVLPLFLNISEMIRLQNAVDLAINLAEWKLLMSCFSEDTEKANQLSLQLIVDDSNFMNVNSQLETCFRCSLMEKRAALL